jgi:putative endonuclease
MTVRVDEGDPRRRVGVLGERLAAAHLESAGYTVLERNFRSRYGELDLVAENGHCLVFCEIKTRVLRGPTRGPPGPFGPFAAIGPGKRRRVRAMAREWLAGDRGAGRRPTSELRFDAIGVELTPDGRLVRLEHLEAAF